jgi:hypothetical protein
MIDKLVDRVKNENQNQLIENSRKEEIISSSNDCTMNEFELVNGNEAVAFREPMFVSGWFQFWTILHKTIICILRDKVLNHFVSKV